MSQAESGFLYKGIKQEYQRRSHIEYLMNPARSFPIEQSYVNLTRVQNKNQYEKKRQGGAAHYGNLAISFFEEIYGVKTAIDVRDPFTVSNGREKQILVYGQAGSGKSTLCRHIAYQWAVGSYWLLGESVVLIPLRHLTTDRYPPNKSYSLIDLVKTEVLSYDLTEKEERLFREQFDAQRTVWLLDGYDEIVSNVPPHLECVFEQLMKTPHHILTSRPISHTLSYDVQMEITDFTDENIEKYVQQFFNLMKDESNDPTNESQTLLKFLQSNATIESIARHPMNLELICSLWNHFDWSQTKQLTITKLYNMITEWLCQQYLLAQSISIQQASKAEAHQRCQKQLAFLESLAFNTMESNTIIISPHLLKKALNEAKISSHESQRIPGLGFLKSQTEQGFSTPIERDNDHTFIHLSFQEYFAARYLINALVGSATGKAIDFIKYQKYNQRYMSVFTFAAGILSGSNTESTINIFWDALLGEPFDLVGIRHMQLVVSCLEETSGKANIPQRNELLQSIARCIQHNVSIRDKVMLQQLSQSLQKAPLTLCDEFITTVLINLLQCSETAIKTTVLDFISAVKICDPSAALIHSISTTLSDSDDMVRKSACDTFAKLGEKVAMIEVSSQLVNAIDDESVHVRISACKALEKIGQKSATNEVISRLANVTADKNGWVSSAACTALNNIGKKATTDEMLEKLASALRGERSHIRWIAHKILKKVDEKAVLNEVIDKLVSALGDANETVRARACDALKIMGEKAATNEVISKLADAIGDDNVLVRTSAWEAFEKMNVKASTNEVISKLVDALKDENEVVRAYACAFLGRTGVKATTSEVINALMSALCDVNEDVRISACMAFGDMSEEALTNDVISKLVYALEDESGILRICACHVLRNIDDNVIRDEVIKTLTSALNDTSESIRELACETAEIMGEKVVTDEMINKLKNAVGDESEHVREKACEALGNMGEKAATDEVINELMNAVGDASEHVREKACEALGNMGEKAATDEVINKLKNAVGDESEHVREKACE